MCRTVICSPKSLLSMLSVIPCILVLFHCWLLVAEMFLTRLLGDLCHMYLWHFFSSNTARLLALFIFKFCRYLLFYCCSLNHRLLLCDICWDSQCYCRSIVSPGVRRLSSFLCRVWEFASWSARCFEWHLARRWFVNTDKCYCWIC